MSSWTPLEIQKNAMPNGFYVNSESQEGIVYQVGLFGEMWKCTCKDYLKKKLPCKHIARVLKHLQETEGGYEEEEAGDASHDRPSFSPLSSSMSKWTKKIHGKDFIRYEGLLAMAHEKGLCELGCEFVSVTSELALATAWAHFKDGRKFKDAADATPNNVGFEVKSHFARIALTRAKARCLRDALNIGMCSVEEIE